MNKLGLTALFALTLLSCHPAQPQAKSSAKKSTQSEVQQTPTTLAAESVSASTTEPSQTPPPSAAPEMAAPYEEPPRESFPKDIVLGKPVAIPVDGDRSLRVSHAAAGISHAIIYLHGMCSDPYGADSWLNQAVKYGTFISLRADVPCDDRPGYKWPKDPVLIQERIERALRTVRDARGGALDLRHVTLVGYSQGANRAELLAGLRPSLYPRIVLGGTPGAAHAENFSKTQRVAFLGGEKEDVSHMVAGKETLVRAGINAEFFLLPNAPHGSYGPRGPQVMTKVLAWLFYKPR